MQEINTLTCSFIFTNLGMVTASERKKTATENDTQMLQNVSL